MTHDISIRIAEHGDVGAVQRVAGEAWRATYAGQIGEADIEDFLATAYSERSLAANVSRFNEGFILAERGGQIIGYAMAGMDRDGQPELFAIYVLSVHHRRGVGHALWNAARDALARQGHQRMCCWALADNERACRFYERQGAFLAEQREFAVGASMILEARYCLFIGKPACQPVSLPVIRGR